MFPMCSDLLGRPSISFQVKQAQVDHKDDNLSLRGKKNEFSQVATDKNCKSAEPIHITSYSEPWPSALQL